jgi:predicted ArsR family transcriptional regulator
LTEPDLFAELAYPAAPGARRNRNSRAAADAMQPRARTLRDRVLALLKDGAFTTDEAAHILGKTVLSVRPRFSELLKMGQIVDTGRTRKNASGISATVWKACAAQERPPPQLD